MRCESLPMFYGCLAEDALHETTGHFALLLQETDYRGKLFAAEKIGLLAHGSLRTACVSAPVSQVSISLIVLL